MRNALSRLQWIARAHAIAAGTMLFAASVSLADVVPISIVRSTSVFAEAGTVSDEVSDGSTDLFGVPVNHDLSVYVRDEIDLDWSEADANVTQESLAGASGISGSTSASAFGMDFGGGSVGSSAHSRIVYTFDVLAPQPGSATAGSFGHNASGALRLDKVENDSVVATLFDWEVDVMGYEATFTLEPGRYVFTADVDAFYGGGDNPSVSEFPEFALVVPEPASGSLICGAALVFGAIRRRSKRA